MYATGTKKMLNMLILEILREYSGEDHRLTQQEIIRLLKQDYGMECDRRSVKANILSLEELGYEISMENGYYLMDRDFEDAELRLLIDAVLFSRHLTAKQAKTLIDKLKKQSNRYFSAKVSHISSLPALPHSDNTQLLYVLDAVNDAITENRKISFVYNEYGVDFKLHPRRQEPYIVNPYQMVANNGRYYLICNVDKYDNIAHFRLDKMTGVCILNESAKPQRQVKGLENGLDLPKHMAEHVYMFAGESGRITMQTSPGMAGELIDWFGNGVTFSDETETSVLAHVTANLQAMRFWALQYAPYVTILAPQSLVDMVKEDLANSINHYKEAQHG